MFLLKLQAQLYICTNKLTNHNIILNELMDYRTLLLKAALRNYNKNEILQQYVSHL